MFKKGMKGAMLMAVILTTCRCKLSNSSTCQDQQGNTYTASFAQTSGNNQDAWVKKTSSGGTLVWQQYYDKSGVDSKGILCFVDDQDELWAVFTVDGGSNDANYINKLAVQSDAFTNVVASGYGSGGGPVAAVIARLNKADGKIVKGTFLSSVLQDGKTNTLTVEYLGTETTGAAASIVVYGKAAAYPVMTGSKLVRDTSLTDADRVDGYFKVRYELSRQLDSILAANGKFRGDVNTAAGTQAFGAIKAVTVAFWIAALVLLWN